MSTPDSHSAPPEAGQTRRENRDTNREIPRHAIPAVAGAALSAAADAFQIHQSRFAEIRRGPGAASLARMAAIEAAVDLAGLSPWQASLAFGVDLSTAKNAVKRAPVKARRDADYAARRDALRAAFAASAVVAALSDGGGHG